MSSHARLVFLGTHAYRQRPGSFSCSLQSLRTQVCHPKDERGWKSSDNIRTQNLSPNPISFVCRRPCFRISTTNPQKHLAFLFLNALCHLVTFPKEVSFLSDCVSVSAPSSSYDSFTIPLQLILSHFSVACPFSVHQQLFQGSPSRRPRLQRQSCPRTELTSACPCSRPLFSPYF